HEFLCTLVASAGRAGRAVCVLLATLILILTLPAWVQLLMRDGFLPMHRANAACIFCHLQQYLNELLSRQLADDAFHLQFKEGSENFARIQSSGFHNVVNMPRLLHAEYLVNPFFCLV